MCFQFSLPLRADQLSEKSCLHLQKQLVMITAPNQPVLKTVLMRPPPQTKTNNTDKVVTFTLVKHSAWTSEATAAEL